MTDPKKFDPARAHVLDAPERERFLPTPRLVALLELRGGETVLDYGTGTGRLAVAVADALAGSGRVVALDERDEMLEHLRARADARVEPVLIAGNAVPLPDGAADRILAVNLLHEIRGETALAEMRRLLAPDGLLLVVDWERGRERPSGPPDRVLYDTADAVTTLEAAGFAVTPCAVDLPYHFALQARPAA